MHIGNEGPISSERVKPLYNAMMALSYHRDSHDAPRSLFNLLVNFEPPMNRGVTDDYREITIHFSGRESRCKEKSEIVWSIAFDTATRVYTRIYKGDDGSSFCKRSMLPDV